MEKEINDLRKKLMEEQGDLGVYQERQAKFSAQKADLEVQLQENLERLAAEERYRSMAGDGKKTAERELLNIKQVATTTPFFMSRFNVCLHKQ
jgi:hypothetical protein